MVRGSLVRGWAAAMVGMYLLQGCTVGGTGLGMAVSHPGQPPDVQTLTVQPRTLNREGFLGALNPERGAAVWITHASGTRVTMGEYAGLAPEDGPKRTRRKGALTVAVVPRLPVGIRVATDNSVVVAPLEDVSAVRLETPQPRYWLIGTAIGFALDVVVASFLLTTNLGVPGL